MLRAAGADLRRACEAAEVDILLAAGTNLRVVRLPARGDVLRAARADLGVACQAAGVDELTAAGADLRAARHPAG